MSYRGSLSICTRNRGSSASHALKLSDTFSRAATTYTNLYRMDLCSAHTSDTVVLEIFPKFNLLTCLTLSSLFVGRVPSDRQDATWYSGGDEQEQYHEADNTARRHVNFVLIIDVVVICIVRYFYFILFVCYFVSSFIHSFIHSL